MEIKEIEFEIGWIKDKDRCWICKRTREEVYADSHPHGDLFDGETDKERLANIFVKEGVEVVCEKFPICRICYYILDDLAQSSTKQYFKDRIG